MKRNNLQNNDHGRPARRAGSVGRVVAAALATAMMAGSLQAADITTDYYVNDGFPLVLTGGSGVDNETLLSGTLTLISGEVIPGSGSNPNLLTLTGNGYIHLLSGTFGQIWVRGVDDYAGGLTKTGLGTAVFNGVFDLGSETVTYIEGGELVFGRTYTSQYESENSVEVGPFGTLRIEAGNGYNTPIVFNASQVTGYYDFDTDTVATVVFGRSPEATTSGTVIFNSSLGGDLLLVQDGRQGDVTIITTGFSDYLWGYAWVKGGELRLEEDQTFNWGYNIYVGQETEGVEAILNLEGTYQESWGIQVYNDGAVLGGTLAASWSQLFSGTVSTHLTDLVVYDPDPLLFAMDLVKVGGTNDVLYLDSANSYTGSTQIIGGKLVVGDDGVFTNSDSLYVGTAGTHRIDDDYPELANEGAELDINGHNVSLSGTVFLGLNGKLSDSKGGGTLTADEFYLADGTVNVVLAGTGALVKVDNTEYRDIDEDTERQGTQGGVVVLGAQNTYEGATVILSGTLQTDVDYAFASSESLVVGGTGSVYGAALDVKETNQSVKGAIDLYSGTLSGSGSLSSSISGTIGLREGSVELVLADYTDEDDSANNNVNHVVKYDDETLVTLGNTNTYTGYTLVRGGTLRTLVDNAVTSSTGVYISGSAASFDIAGTTQEVNELHLYRGSIDNSGTTGKIVSATDYDVRRGSINAELSGSVGLVKSGRRTVDLNVAASYTGTTHINNGTLRLNVDDALTESAGIRVSGRRAALDVAGTEQTVAGVLLWRGTLDDSVGGGSLAADTGFYLRRGNVNVELTGDSAELHKFGNGTVNLNVANSYGGDTYIFGGRLNTYASNAIHGNVAIVDATLDIRDTRQQIGAVYLDEESRILMTSGSTYNWGVLELGSDFYESEIHGLVSGEGWIEKYGRQALVLSGTIETDGYTEIHEGAIILVENDSYNIDIQGVWVNVNGALTGNGVVLGDVWNDGVVAPGGANGNSGRITVGAYLPSASGNLVVGINAANQNDMLIVSGTTVLDGTLSVVNRGRKVTRNDKWKVLESAELEGQFAGFAHNLGNTMLKPKVRYTEDEVWVEMEQQSFKTVAKTPNQRSIGRALDRAADRGELGRIFDYINYADVDNVPALLQALSPEQLTAIFNIGLSTAQIQNTNIERRLDDVRGGARGFSANGLALSNSRGTLNYDGMPIVNDRDGLTLAGFDGKSVVGKQTVAPVVSESRWGFFATGSGEWTDIETVGDARGSQLNSGGITIGADYRVSDNLVVGINAGYSHTGSDLDRGGKVEANGGRAGVYASLFGNGAYLNAAVDGGYNSYQLRRGTLGGIARGNTEGGSFNSLIGGGYDFTAGSFIVGPVASVQYSYVGFNGYQESGSDAPLNVRSSHQDSLRTTLGAKVATAWNVGGVVIRPEVRAQWKHEFLDTKGAIDSSFTGSGALFTVHGPNVGRDSLVIDAGASVQINNNVSVYAFYTGEVGRTNYSSNSVNGGFRINF